MTRVQFIVTGDAERIAFHRPFARLFAAHGLECLAPIKSSDFTSNPLPAIPPNLKDTKAWKLAASLVEAVRLGSSGARPDLVIAVDDVELANQHQLARIIDWFSASVRAYVTQTYRNVSDQNQIFDDLRDRASFHLLNPMLEAGFFGEPASLARAKADKAPNRFDAAVHDFEDFEVDDPDYLGPAPAGALWDAPNRARHPKHYVRFLSDPSGTKGRIYRETHEGVDALMELDWLQVVSPPIPKDFAQLVRSMLDDVNEALGRPLTIPGTCHPLTDRRTGPNMLLRNIQ